MDLTRTSSPLTSDAADEIGRSEMAAGVFAPDTTIASPLHHYFARGGELCSRRPLSLLAAYISAVACTYVPLLCGAFLSPIPLTTVSPELRLPFLMDWNVSFMFLVSFPVLLILTLTDDYVLTAALRRVHLDGVVLLTGGAFSGLRSRWEERFRQLNLFAYGLGAVAGCIVAAANYAVYAPPEVGFWIAVNGQLALSGYIYLYCIFVFYALVTVYVCRSIAISLLLKDIVAHSELHLLPAHPDRCGGLRPIGQLGLRNQYVLSVCGINVVLLIGISVWYLDVPKLLYVLILAAILAYMTLGPLVFMGPLLPFRRGMLRTKSALMSEVAQRLRVELRRIHGELSSGPITKEDEELVDRLRKFGSIIDELPVWPFDSGTLRKVVTAYVIPLIGAVSYPVAKWILETLLDFLNA